MWWSRRPLVLWPFCCALCGDLCVALFQEGVRSRRLCSGSGRYQTLTVMTWTPRLLLTITMWWCDPQEWNEFSSVKRWTIMKQCCLCKLFIQNCYPKQKWSFLLFIFFIVQCVMMQLLSNFIDIYVKDSYFVLLKISSNKYVLTKTDYTNFKIPRNDNCY